MKSSAPKRKTKKEFSIVYCLQRRICLVCHSSIEESKLGDDSFVDEAAVAAVMGLFNCSYAKAVDIWTADRIAAQERSSKSLRRQPTKSLLYPNVPEKDQELYAGMSDVARKQYMTELSKPSKASVQPSSKQHKKQISFAKKNLHK